MKRDRRQPIPPEVSAALDSHTPKRLDLLVAHCTEAPGSGSQKPVFERLREKIGAELTRLLVFALAGDQRARRAGRPA
jgi:hypothetical protein